MKYYAIKIKEDRELTTFVAAKNVEAARLNIDNIIDIQEITKNEYEAVIEITKQAKKLRKNKSHIMT